MEARTRTNRVADLILATDIRWTGDFDGPGCQIGTESQYDTPHSFSKEGALQCHERIGQWR